MLTSAFFMFALCFVSFEANEVPDSSFLKTYAGDASYSVGANSEGMKVLMKDLILRQPNEAVPETSASSRVNTSATNVKEEQQQMWSEPGSLHYLIAKLEGETPRSKISFSPFYDELMKRKFRAVSAGHKAGPFPKRNFDPIDSSGFGDFYKRNFDPIDSSGFGDFYKRNFDPIDSSGFGDFYKRSVVGSMDASGAAPHLLKRNFDPIDSSGFGDFYKRSTGVRSSNKRNFDPIDSSGFGDFYKRSVEQMHKSNGGHLTNGNFDPIDSSGFSDFYKRSIEPFHRASGGHLTHGNFDPIDSSGFSDFYKRNAQPTHRSGMRQLTNRNFDPIDSSGFSDLWKRSVDQGHSS